MTLPNHDDWPQPHLTDHVRPTLVVTLSHRPYDTDPSVEVILEAVAEEYGLDPHEILARTRRQPIAIARQLVMYLLRITTPLTLEAIGHAVGGRHHATVHHAIRSIEGHRTYDRTLDARVYRLTKQITA